jgi:diacylglycerol kinase (ATP)
MSHFRGTLRYIVALLAELREFQLHHYTVRMDGVQRSGSAVLIAVGNGSSYGGGMQICPQADMKDGLLDITWVDPAPRRTVLRIFPQIFSGRHVNHPLVHTYRAAEVAIESPDSMIYADGERIGSPPVLIQVVPQAVRVLLSPAQKYQRRPSRQP